jgi:hypothetical protein
MSLPRVPLYSPTVHSLARGLSCTVACFGGLGVLVGAVDILRQPSPFKLAMVAAFATLTSAFVRNNLRAQPIFGTAEGLVTTRNGDHTIPWSKVGNVEFPISSFNPVFRRYCVRVRDETAPIHFFAGRREVERLEQLRRRASA